MLELRPTTTVVGVTPVSKILLPDYWVRFSNKFPDTLDHVRGKTARIAKQQQVPFLVTKKIKEGCYIDVDLSNESSGQKLYPNVAENLYEVLIGFKEGNYLTHIFFPSDFPIYQLDYPGMTPSVASSTLKYLGAVKPTDSPVENPTFRLYFVYKLKPIILRLLADDGVADEKVTLELMINRCQMSFEQLPPNITPKPILYLDEIKWIGATG
jgi:hypothetical protein